MLLRHVPVPSLGRFLIKELQSTENSIIQILLYLNPLKITYGTNENPGVYIIEKNAFLIQS